MKIKVIVLLALIAGIFAGVPAKAADVTASTGDLILAFRVKDGAGTGGTTDLEVDLGTAANLVSEANANGGTLTLSNSSGLAVQDLRSIYGDGSTDSSWNTRSDLVWSVVGTDAGLTNDLWVTSPNDAKVPKTASASTQSGPGGKINAIYDSLNEEDSTANSTEAVAVPSGQGNSYSTGIRGASPGYSKDYNYFSNSTENGVPSSGTESSDLYYLPSGAVTNGTDLGTFTLASDGDFTFSTGESVPEPANWVAMALAGGGIALMIRRRRTVAT